MKDLLFLNSNRFVPTGHAFNTARKGTKWFNQVKVGDVVALKVTETSEVFGHAVVTGCILTTYEDVIRNYALSNCCAFGPKCSGNGRRSPANVLDEELTASYGSSSEWDEFSIINMVQLNEAPAPAADANYAKLLKEYQEQVAEVMVLAAGGQLANQTEDFCYVTAVERITTVGDIQSIVRVEFEPD